MKQSKTYLFLAKLIIPCVFLIFFVVEGTAKLGARRATANEPSAPPSGFPIDIFTGLTSRQARPADKGMFGDVHRSQLSASGVLNGLPMVFEANRGQMSQSARFVARGDGYLLSLKNGGALLAFAHDASTAKELGPHQKASAKLLKRPARWISSAVQMELVGSDPDAHVAGEGERSWKTNYFVGNDPSRWLTGVPVYERVRYQNLYQDTDLIYHGRQGSLEYDFIVNPGGRPEQITMGFQGARKIFTDSAGDLVVKLYGGSVILRKPVAYQGAGNAKRIVPSQFRLKGLHEVGFEVGPYDPARTLVIDPVLSYSTFLGGTGTDQAKAITIDSAGNVYVTGTTLSTNFPVTSGVIQGSLGGATDIFVSKLDPTGSTLLYSTYLGGTSDDISSHIAVDSSGDAFITGLTTSSDFPTTTGAFQTSLKGSDNCLVAELNPAGSALVYSTYLGGSGVDFGNSLALDSSGEVYVVGATDSSDFPTTAGAFQTVLASTGVDDAFVTKLNSGGTALVYSTYLGGTGTDQGTGIAIDSTGSAYVTGFTQSTNFPTASPLQSASGGSADAFITKLSPDGTSLVYSTYLGGSGNDIGDDLALDSSLNAYVAGSTSSTNFPLMGAYQSTLKGTANVFVSKINAAGSSLIYSTYLGGSGSDLPSAVAVDSSGTAYITGQTSSADFPLADALQTALLSSSNVFVTKLDATGATLDYSTYLGGSQADSGTGIAVDSSGNVYLAGQTSSPNLPIIGGSYQTTLGGGTDAFVAKIGASDSPAVSLFPASLTFADQSVSTVSTPLTVVLRNVGSGALTVSSVVASGDFVQTNNCFSGIAAASNCAITVTFAPTAKGTRTGSVSISDDAAGSPHTIALSGKGIDTSVTLSTNSLTFAEQALGTTSAAQTVTLTDTGTDALPITGITVTGDFAQTNTCGTSVAAGGSCAISVTFSPTKALARTGTLSITANAPGSPQMVTLSGTGLGPDDILSSSSLTFGEQPVGTASGAQTLTLTNDGNTALSIASVTLTGSFAQTNNCGSSLAAGANCAFTVTFNPTAAGATFGALSIIDNAPGSPHVITLTGNAIAGQAPEASFSSSTLSFGSQPVTTPSNTQSLTLTNTGNATLTITSIAVSGDYSQTNTCGTSLAAGANCSISIIFTPKALGTDNATLTVTDNATGSPHTVPLSGAGADFVFTATTSTATVTAGQTATYTLMVNPEAGFNQQVALTCSGAPLNSMCAFDKPTVTLNGTNPTTVMISVATTMRSSVPPKTPGRWGIPPSRPLDWLLVVLAAGILMTLTSRRPKLRRVWLVTSLAAFFLLLSACAVGSKVTGTPAGNYSFTVTGTTTVNGATLTHSGNFGLTVN